MSPTVCRWKGCRFFCSSAQSVCKPNGPIAGNRFACNVLHVARTLRPSEHRSERWPVAVRPRTRKKTHHGGTQPPSLESYGEPRARRRPCTEARQRWPVRQPDQCAVLTRCKGRRRSPKSDSSSSPSNRRANGGRPPTFWKAPSPNNPTCEPEVGFRQSQRFRRRLCRHERPGASQARDRSRRRRRAQHSDGGATRYGIQILCWVRD